MLINRNRYGLSGAAGGFSVAPSYSAAGGFTSSPPVSVTSVPGPAGPTFVTRGATPSIRAALSAAIAAQTAATTAAEEAAQRAAGVTLRGTAAAPRGPAPMTAEQRALTTAAQQFGTGGGGGSYTMPDGTVVPVAPQGLLAKFGAMGIVGKALVIGAIGGAGYLGYRTFFKGHGGAAGALPKSSQSLI